MLFYQDINKDKSSNIVNKRKGANIMILNFTNLVKVIFYYFSKIKKLKNNIYINFNIFNN